MTSAVELLASYAVSAVTTGLYLEGGNCGAVPESCDETDEDKPSESAGLWELWREEQQEPDRLLNKGLVTQFKERSGVDMPSTATVAVVRKPHVQLPIPQIDIESESDSVLRSSPRILTPHMMQQLIDNGLPASIGLTKRWVRLYSLSRDGDSFDTFLNRVSNHRDTVLVVKTMSDQEEVFGGFTATTWEKSHSDLERVKFYGTGRSFLFSFVPRDGPGGGISSAGGATVSSSQHNPHPVVRMYPWAGRNNFNQLCSANNATIAMGGGGNGANFGLCVEENFRRGSSGYCDTYDNECLATRELFDLEGFEVYGFVNQY